MYESFDMTIEDIKVLYNYNNYRTLLVDKPDVNFTVFDKFTLGF